MKSSRISRKVASFVLRNLRGSKEILLINHPNTAYQLPAGTVKKKENFETAALRETREETGLEELSVISSLGSERREYSKKARIWKAAKIYSKPSKTAFKFGKLRKGLKVKIIAERGDFYQVRYRERDNTKVDRPVMLLIVGWVRKSNVTKIEERSFFILGSGDERNNSWEQYADRNQFVLEWHPLNDLPNLVSSQQRWLDKYLDQIKSVDLQSH